MVGPGPKCPQAIAQASVTDCGAVEPRLARAGGANGCGDRRVIKLDAPARVTGRLEQDEPGTTGAALLVGAHSGEHGARVNIVGDRR